MTPRELPESLNELDEQTRIEAKLASEAGKKRLGTYYVGSAFFQSILGVASGELSYLYPDKPNRPDQKYLRKKPERTG